MISLKSTIGTVCGGAWCSSIPHMIIGPVFLWSNSTCSGIGIKLCEFTVCLTNIGNSATHFKGEVTALNGRTTDLRDRVASAMGKSIKGVEKDARKGKGPTGGSNS